MSLWVWDWVDLADYFDEFLSRIIIFRRVQKYLSFILLSLFEFLELLFDLNRVCNEPPRVGLNQHELKHVQLFDLNPVLVKAFEIDPDVFLELLESNMRIFFDSPKSLFNGFLQCVDIFYHLLDLAEPIKQFFARFEHIRRENVFFSVYIEERESWEGQKWVDYSPSYAESKISVR